jgi:hypothetical protein
VTRAVAALGVVLAMMLPAVAQAIDPLPLGTPVYGTVTVLKDRRAGFFEDVQTISREVTYVRDGVERPLTPEMTLYEGDAIRTAAGTCVVETPAGWRVEIGEASQVRLERSVIQRLGEVFYQVMGSFSVQVGDVELLVEGTGFKVTRDLPGNGELIVVEGGVRYRIPNLPGEKVAAGYAFEFTQEAAGTLRGLDPGELDALRAWRAERFEPGGAVGLRRNRVLIRIEGGLTFFDRLQGWGRGGVQARVRAYGPLWIGGGVGVMARLATELPTVPVLLAIPAHVGARFTADLPRSFFITGGVDFTLLVGGQCSDQLTCSRITVVEPGGRVVAGVGLLLSRRVGLDLEFGGGIARFVLPPVDSSIAPTAIVAPQLHLSLGVFIRL